MILLELLVIVGVSFLIIARPQVSVPLNTLPVAHYRKGGTTAHLTLYPGRSLKKKWPGNLFEFKLFTSAALQL